LGRVRPGRPCATGSALLTARSTLACGRGYQLLEAGTVPASSPLNPTGSACSPPSPCRTSRNQSTKPSAHSTNCTPTAVHCCRTVPRLTSASRFRTDYSPRSTTAAEFLRAGHEVTVYDNLSRGHRAAVPAEARFVQGDIGDAAALVEALRPGFDAALHFGALIEAGESMRDPGAFFANNVANTVTLLNALLSAGVERFVFSSSAGVYGEPQELPIPELHVQRPVKREQAASPEADAQPTLASAQ